MGDLGLTPGLKRSPGGGCDNPCRCPCLENPYGKRKLVGYSHAVRQNWATTHTTVCIYGVIAYIFSQQYLFLIGIFALNVNIDVFGLKYILSFAVYLTNSVLFLSFLVLFWSVVISISSLYWLDNVLIFYCLVPSPQLIRSYIFFYLISSSPQTIHIIYFTYQSVKVSPSFSWIPRRGLFLKYTHSLTVNHIFTLPREIVINAHFATFDCYFWRNNLPCLTQLLLLILGMRLSLQNTSSSPPDFICWGGFSFGAWAAPVNDDLTIRGLC